MRPHTPLMKTVRQWRPLTRELHGLAADGSLELLTLSADELEQLRQQAADLAATLTAWQTTHRPRAGTPASRPTAASLAPFPLPQEA